MSQTGKVTPNLDHKTTKVLNLTVLQRIDPSIEGILTTAAHVTLYEFNIESNQWSRKDVEGSLFVVKRTTHPRFQFIVMNRRNTENLVENLLGDFEYEVQGPYLLYRNQSQEVNGIWFYNPRECEEIANLFTRILNPYSKVPPKSDFEELEAPPSMSVFEGPLEPSSTASAATVAPGDNAIENFFSSVLNAGHGNSTSTVANSRQLNHSSAALPFSSHMPTVASSLASTQTPLLPFSSVPASMPFHEPADTTSSSSNRVTSLVKPSSFFTPVSSSSQLVARPISSALPTAPTLQTPLNLQRPQGTPMLQPPPPLTPPPSLTPFSTLQPVITKEKVRGTLLMLAQDDQFIDMFHRAMLKVQHS